MVQLSDIGTCNHLVLAVKQELCYWRQGLDAPDITGHSQGIQKVLTSQRQLGWRLFLDGLVSKEWKRYMEEYFLERKSKKGAGLWTSRLIRANWELIFTLWTNRNSQLHNTARIEDLKGKEEIINGIKEEFRIGLGGLPAYGFSSMFSMKEAYIVKRSMDFMIQWLSIVKQGRIVHNDPRQLRDGFYKPGALRNLLELNDPNEVTERKQNQITKALKRRAVKHKRNSLTKRMLPRKKRKKNTKNQKISK